MLRERAPVVQCGVQLMNYADRWFSALNVLEYFFWFKSRMHYHAAVGMVPLGGNTVFIRRDLLDELGGWDQTCLTEDADIGIRLSAAGIPIRVVYDDALRHPRGNAAHRRAVRPAAHALEPGLPAGAAEGRLAAPAE